MCAFIRQPLRLPHKRVQRLLLCILSSLLLYFSFEPFCLFPLAWFSLLPLLLAIEELGWGAAFLLGFLSGAVFWSLSVSWVCSFHPAAALLVPYLALYTAAYTASLRKRVIFSPFLASFIWVLLEFARGSTKFGFCWLLLSHTQTPNVAILQLCSVLGSHSLSYIITLSNHILFLLIRKRTIKLFAAFLAIVFILHLFGAARMKQIDECGKVLALQTNNEKSIEKIKKIALLYKGVNLLILPEAFIPFPLSSYKIEELKALSESMNCPILFGAFWREDDALYNSAFFLSKEGMIGRYDKRHLVPFGETLPSCFEWLRAFIPQIGDFKEGKETKIFYCKSIPPFLPIICFEDTRAHFVRSILKGKDGTFIVNITDDAWSRSRLCHIQHHLCSIFRAVECGTYIVRATNTGVTSVIDPFGRREQIPIYQRGALLCSVSGSISTPYKRWGELPFILLSLCCVGVDVFRILTRRAQA